MKKLFVTLSLLFAFTTLTSAQDFSMSAILSEAAPIIELVEGEYNQEIVRMEYDIISSTTKSSYRELVAGYTYGIFAFGDYRIKDLDIRVYKSVDGEWMLVKKDEEAQDPAIVFIEPSVTGTYRIDISAYEFEPGYSAAHYGLIICHE